MAIAQIAQMFYEPTQAFTAIKEKPRAWVPLVILMSLTALLIVWFFQTVDMAWLLEHSFPPDVDPDKRAAAAQFMTREKMMSFGLIGALVAMPIIFALFGLYYWVAAKITGMDFNYGRSFAIAVWGAVPALIEYPLMALQIATGHGQLRFEDTKMLTLNFLVLHARPFTPWAGFADNLSIPMIWGAVLVAFGLKAWSGKSMATCATVAALPLVVIYGCWAAKIAFLG